MGLRFRKSFTFGPLRINVSKSGIGFSLGVKGFRVGRSAKGKTTATVSLPGTGLSYVQDLDAESIQETVEDIKDIFDGDNDSEKETKKSTKKNSAKSEAKKKKTTE
jgi:hypothetical protein